MCRYLYSYNNFLKITEIILSYRAKKLDNLENWLIILVIDLFVIMALCYIDILSVQRVTESIIYFVKINTTIILLNIRWNYF